MRRALSSLILFVLAAVVHAAETPNVIAEPLPPHGSPAGTVGTTETSEHQYQAFVRTRMGMVKAPFYLEDIPQVRSEITQALSFVVGGHLRIRPELTLGVRFGMAPSLVALPAGSYADAKAFGNLEFNVTRPLASFHWNEFVIDHGIRAALVLPTATHGPTSSVLRNRVLAISNAIEGWLNQELFTPGIGALAATYQLSAQRHRHRVELMLNTPLLVRLRDASLPDGVNARRLSLTPDMTIRAETAATRWLRIGLAAHLAAAIPAPVEMPDGSFQTSLEPQVRFQIGEHVSVQTDLLIPIGGPLHGSAGLGIGAAGSF